MIVRHWTALAAALLAMLLAAPASATWRKAESANFVVFSQSGEAKVREQVALLEDYHAFLRLLTGVDDPPTPNKLRVYLMKGSDMRLARDFPKAVAGFYIASPNGIAAFVDVGGWGAGNDDILFHEIAHHFMMQYRPAAYPAWFVEGFAEYVMTAQLKEKTIDFGLPNPDRAAQLSRSRWLPVERVLFQRASGTPEERGLFYAQSWLLAHYVMRDEGRRQKFKAYVAAISGGTPQREAFAAQFGDTKAFGRALETYADRQLTYSRLTRASAAAAPAVRVETLPPSAEELLPAEAALHIGQSGKFAVEVLAKVRAETARHPADPYAKRVLAMAEVLHGDRSKGEALIDQLLAAAPGDAELLYLKGMRHLLDGRSDEAKRKEKFAQARTWFSRAHKADPNHWRALARYTESLSTDSRYNSDNTLNILLLARELAPQVVELTMNSAALLMLRGRHSEAEQILLPLASNPHHEGLAAAAQALLEKARAKAAPDSRPAASPSGE
jgi:Flp pilus assembly protein TadD